MTQQPVSRNASTPARPLPPVERPRTRVSPALGCHIPGIRLAFPSPPSRPPRPRPSGTHGRRRAPASPNSPTGSCTNHGPTAPSNVSPPSPARLGHLVDNFFGCALHPTPSPKSRNCHTHVPGPRGQHPPAHDPTSALPYVSPDEAQSLWPDTARRCRPHLRPRVLSHHTLPPQLARTSDTFSKLAVTPTALPAPCMLPPWSIRAPQTASGSDNPAPANPAHTETSTLAAVPQNAPRE
jgi:hypothetical protein